ncbi:MAG: hypothetical protein AVO38_11675 [delta proteobacterium ML8_D]|nr:MAG: hypothetical protein AVO38_11675 [delta proteobacterium ML8_D]
MNNLHGLLYPASYLRKDTMLRLNQVFSKLTLLLPSENFISLSPISNTCSMEIKANVPIPLGDRLEWFTEIVDNWKSWAEEIGLGEKTPASTLLSAAKGEEESLQSILKKLRGDEVSDPLLDAQIFLQLSLDLDRRNDEVQIELDRMTIHEGKLKSILQDPLEITPSSDAFQKLYSPAIKPLLRPKERLRAWALLWQKYTDPEPCPIGETIALKDLIDKSYEALQPREAPAEILNLVLPLDPNISPKKSDKFINRLKSLVQATSNTTIKDFSKNSEIQKLAKEITHDWDTTVMNQSHGPALNLTIYPKRTWNEIFFKAAGLKPPPIHQSANQYIGWSFFLY